MGLCQGGRTTAARSINDRLGRVPAPVSQAATQRGSFIALPCSALTPKAQLQVHGGPLGGCCALTGTLL